MKRRTLLSLIRATASFLAVAIAFGNLSPAKNTGAVEEMTVTDGGRPRQIGAPAGTPEGVSRAGAFGVNETATMGISFSGEAQPFDICPMGIGRRLRLSTRIVFLILLIMSICSIVIVVERYLTFSAARNQTREFVPKIVASLKSQNIDVAISLSDKYEKSHLAVVVKAGLQRFRDDQLSSDISGAVLEASERASRLTTAIKLVEFKRGLSGLAIIGSTAPLVGLFGTALGVNDAVAAMGESASAGVVAVAGGIAEVLLTTAAGLAVGIPVVWLFNYFTNQVDNFVIEMDDASAELTSFFLKQCDKKYI
jgi:biopolymer transport protein ExbB/biopolymer transport protein TolQ